MDPKYSGNNQQDTPRIPHAISPSYYFSTEQAHGAGRMDPEFRRLQHGYIRNNYPHNLHQHHPQDMHEVIRREIEKERIREEIIMSEIVRRRVLEAEVRRELMMEREMAMQRGSDGIPYGSSPVMRLESPMQSSLLGTRAEGWSAEERLGMSLDDKEKQIGRLENGGLDASPFQRTADLRILEVKPASEGNNEKERILLLTKTDENASGSKTKDVTAPEVVNIELLADDIIANKIAKEEWSCALCQVTATSEKDLNEHVLEKKHKSKVAALRAQGTRKNYRIGLFPKKATKPIHVKEKGLKLKARCLFSQKAGKATSKKDDLPLSENPKSKLLKKTQAEVIRKVQKNEDDLRKKVEKNEKVMNAHKLGNIELPADVSKNKKWSCALCQVIATSENDLNEHVLGKKHKSKVAELKALRTGKNHSIPKKAAKSIHVGEQGVKLKAQSLFYEKVEEATSKKDDLPISGNPKSEHLKKTQSEVIGKLQKNEDDPRKKVEKKENDPRKKGCMYSEVMNAHKLGNIELPADVTANKKSEWNCALCQVYATSEKGLNEHVLGKKHKSKEAASRSSEG
ncbi:uncharacterized protein LOC142529048 isoform X1 [Primulina tabacum]|uniref:uncharacterized protein LOC142529048 isoform X1 n=1 Tax=Primulina tabacum TaxID=48773 RepID=UPI003F593CB9